MRDEFFNVFVSSDEFSNVIIIKRKECSMCLYQGMGLLNMTVSRDGIAQYAYIEG